MQNWISCDWGTSSLRIRLVGGGNNDIIAGVESDKGIASTYLLWKQADQEKKDRVSFYAAVLDQEIKKLEAKLGQSLDGLPMVISGMASSNIGMRELPYKEIPVHSGGDDLLVEELAAAKDFHHSILLISGIRTDEDVMRGEETQLIGCLDKNGKEEALLLFPGTHSKHAYIENGLVKGFRTFMTGEFFELLSAKSILAPGVEVHTDLFGETSLLDSFKKGVLAGRKANLLNGSFHARTNALFNKLNRQENYSYLSGLLIGYELKEAGNDQQPVTIVGSRFLNRCYEAALHVLGREEVVCRDAAEAVITGQDKIRKHFGKAK